MTRYMVGKVEVVPNDWDGASWWTLGTANVWAGGRSVFLGQVARRDDWEDLLDSRLGAGDPLLPLEVD